MSVHHEINWSKRLWSVWRLIAKHVSAGSARNRHHFMCWPQTLAIFYPSIWQDIKGKKKQSVTKHLRHSPEIWWSLPLMVASEWTTQHNVDKFLLRVRLGAFRQGETPHLIRKEAFECKASIDPKQKLYATGLLGVVYTRYGNKNKQQQSSMLGDSLARVPEVIANASNSM